MSQAQAPQVQSSYLAQVKTLSQVLVQANAKDLPEKVLGQLVKVLVKAPQLNQNLGQVRAQVLGRDQEADQVQAQNRARVQVQVLALVKDKVLDQAQVPGHLDHSLVQILVKALGQVLVLVQVKI
jgi:hypothetical protein